MGAIANDLSDDFCYQQYATEKRQKDNKYKSILEEFENLTLEEKVDKLIECYAFETAYCE
ncbi:MAG: hypothetical protein J6K73_02150 [Clostridia bacterium]|nr:hypothetical protein [Clostridia bacterium]